MNVRTPASAETAGPVAGAPATASKVTRYVILVRLIAAIGGLAFGYDTGVISGAILFIPQRSNLGARQTDLVTASVLLSTMMGALIGGSWPTVAARARRSSLGQGKD